MAEDDFRRIAVRPSSSATPGDLAHPLAHAEALAALIPGARLAAITPKADDRAAYLRDFRAALAAFLGAAA